jgi:hypothetical protein
MYAACGHLWPGTVRPGMSFFYFNLPPPLSLFLFRFGVCKSMLAEGRYEIEIGPGVFNRWID